MLLLRGAQLLQQRLRRLIKECRLPLITDLDNRHISEPSLPIGLDRLHDCIKIGTAGNLLGNVFRPNELARPVEPRWRRKVCVHRPATTKPAELIMGSVNRPLLIGIPADRYLPDLACVRALLLIPGLDQLRLGLNGHKVISEWGELCDRLLTRHCNRDRYTTLG